MPFFDIPPGTQLLWLEHQACVLCGNKATLTAITLQIPKERMAQLKADPSQLSEVTITLNSRPYCTVCSPCISYEKEAHGRQRVPELKPPPERPAPGWLAKKLGMIG